jgi:hypothetical protein
MLCNRDVAISLAPPPAERTTHSRHIERESSRRCTIRLVSCGR